jgi:hypothetical protein
MIDTEMTYFDELEERGVRKGSERPCFGSCRRSSVPCPRQWRSA